MHKFGRSGRTDNALDTPGSYVYSLFGANPVNTGRTFWCRGIIVYNSNATDAAVVDIYDGTDAAVATAAEQKMTILCPAATTTIVEFSAPGIDFYEDCCAATTGGDVATYEAGCWGYETGPGMGG